jgi:transketolase
MTVISIGDPNMIRDILYLSLDYPGPMFIRLAQGKNDRMLYEPGTIQFEIGKGLIARGGKDVTVFAHGEMVAQALDAAEILAKEGIDVRVVDMYSIKPLDEELVLRCTEETGKVLVLEDHLTYGGLASAIADLYVDKGIVPKKFKRMGTPQVYAGFGSGEELRDKYGYGLEGTLAAIRALAE